MVFEKRRHLYPSNTRWQYPHRLSFMIHNRNIWRSHTVCICKAVHMHMSYRSKVLPLDSCKLKSNKRNEAWPEVIRISSYSVCFPIYILVVSMSRFDYQFKLRIAYFIDSSCPRFYSSQTKVNQIKVCIYLHYVGILRVYFDEIKNKTCIWLLLKLLC